MKKLSLITVSLFASLMAHAAPIVISAPVQHLYVPKGFDNNDNVEVFVSGTFPNTCYSRNKVEVQVKDQVIDVSVTALLNQGNEHDCEDIKIDYLENVTIGNLQADIYDIRVNGRLTEKLEVTEARSSSMDDYIYAQVDYIDLGFTGGLTGEVFLIGRTADCVVFDRLEMISNGKDTISVLPIMRVASNSCAKQRIPFSIPVKFDPKLFTGEKMLLFVKTMDGKSVNSLIELR